MSSPTGSAPGSAPGPAMPAADVARKSVGFFLLTSVVPVAMLALVGVGLATGVLPGHASVLPTLVPAAVALGAIARTLALGRLSRRLETREPAD